MDLEGSLMKQSLQPPLHELGNSGIRYWLSICKRVVYLYKIEILPYLLGKEADLYIEQMEFEGHRHCPIEFQEEVTSFPELEGLKVDLFFNLFKGHS